MKKYLDRLKSLVGKGEKEKKGNGNQKKVRVRGLGENSKNFPVLSGSSESLSRFKDSLHPYRLTKQRKRGSFTGFVVKWNKKGRPYRGFISVKIWEQYVEPGSAMPSQAKIDWMMEVSKILREGYQDPPAVSPGESGELPGAPPLPSDGALPADPRLIQFPNRRSGD